MSNNKKKIAIGVDASPICNVHPTGVARYTRNLIDSLIAHPETKDQFEIDLLYRLSRYKKRELRYIPEVDNVKWFLGNTVFRRKKYRIVHSCDSKVVNWNRTIKIATVYDLTIFLEEYKKYLQTAKSFYDIQWSKLRNCARNADAIIAISKNTKNDFLKFFDFPEDKIFAVYPGIEPVYFGNNMILMSPDKIRTSLKIERGYLLFVGVISYRKNSLGLIQAYYNSGAYKEYDLVLAGGAGPGMEEITGLINKLGLNEQIKLTGYVPDSLLPSLYANAKALVFPTFYEGFGIPIIEAMLSRTPVLIGNKGSAPEVAGGLVIEVDSCAIDSIADGIQKVMQMSEEQIDKAYSHAQKFKWTTCAEKIVNIYKNYI